MFTAWTDVGPAQGRPWTIGGRARGVRRGAAVHGRRVRVPPMACRLSGIEQLEENAMKAILKGVKVVEVAAWTYVPMAGAVLAEWGAEVIKIEHPEHGDPQRGLINSGLVPGGGSVNHMMEVPNRGKKSVGLDLASPAGHEVLLKLVAEADVFLTNCLPTGRRKLGIDVADLRAVNPDI